MSEILCHVWLREDEDYSSRRMTIEFLDGPMKDDCYSVDITEKDVLKLFEYKGC